MKHEPKRGDAGDGLTDGGLVLKTEQTSTVGTASAPGGGKHEGANRDKLDLRDTLRNTPSAEDENDK